MWKWFDTILIGNEPRNGVSHDNFTPQWQMFPCIHHVMSIHGKSSVWSGTILCYVLHVQSRFHELFPYGWGMRTEG